MWKRIDCNVGESTRRQNDLFVVVQSEQGKKRKKGLNGTPLHDKDLHHLAIVLSQRRLVKYQFKNSAQFKAGRSFEFLLSNARDSRGDVGRLETPYCSFSSRLSDVQAVILLKAKNSRLVLFPFHRDRQWQIDYCKPEREQGKDYMRKKMQSKSWTLKSSDPSFSNHS